MKIEAATRLQATEGLSLKALIGLDGKLNDLTDSHSTFILDKPADQGTIQQISNKLRMVPKHGRQGSTTIYVWEFTADMALVLYVPTTGKASVEIYDR